MNDKIYKIWRPSAAEQKPPAPLVETHCYQCQKEKAARHIWKAESGTLKEWLDRFHLETDKDALIVSWGICNTIQWERSDMKILIAAYVRHLANIVSQEYWDKKIEKKTVFSALKAVS